MKKNRVRNPIAHADGGVGELGNKRIAKRRLSI